MSLQIIIIGGLHYILSGFGFEIVSLIGRTSDLGAYSLCKIMFRHTHMKIVILNFILFKSRKTPNSHHAHQVDGDTQMEMPAMQQELESCTVDCVPSR